MGNREVRFLNILDDGFGIIHFTDPKNLNDKRIIS
jgi:hypothetical protein